MIPLINPQIVNGCQTVSSIKKVLENYSDEEREEEFKNVFVMVKALVVGDAENESNRDFYENVVKYTNKQNAISDKAFASDTDNFYRLQKEFGKRGFFLLVKPSDKNKFKELSKNKKNELLDKAQNYINNIGISLEKRNDICIQLEKLLQVFLAFIKDGYYAFTKKNKVLDESSELYEEYCSCIHDYLTVDNMINLYYFYKRAEFGPMSIE